MHSEGLDILIEKYLNGQATEEERKKVDLWYQSQNAGPALSDKLGPQAMEDLMEKSLRKLRSRLD